MNDLTTHLVKRGIAEVSSPFAENFLAEINKLVDPILKERQAQPRAYVHSDELAQLGLLVPLLGEGGMRSLITTVLPDPVLYHCHIYEIEGNRTQSHIFSESLQGWHCDGDSKFDGRHATHLSIFLYLSDVDLIDGPFEFCPQSPSERLHSSTPTVSVVGHKNYCFIWNRSFFHRAAPNRGPKRRRLLKLSIQPNSAFNQHIGTGRFEAVRRIIPAGDPYLDTLLGRYYGQESPLVATTPNVVSGADITPNTQLGVPTHLILEAVVKAKARAATQAAKRWIGLGNQQALVNYD